MSCDVVWTAWSGPGLEHLHLVEESDRVVADGLLIGVAATERYNVRYRIECDSRWRVRELLIEMWLPFRRSLVLHADGAGRWSTNDRATMPLLEGAVDVDITASAFTNTLPIRRLGGVTGVSEEIVVAYLHVPELRVESVRQRYTLLERSADGSRWRYENVITPFVADLPVDADGLVLDYPNLFRRIWPATLTGPRVGVGISAVIERDGHVLLLRRSAAKDHAPGEWEPVSGGVEPGESLAMAAVREAKEETGLDVEVLDRFDCHQFQRGAARRETVLITFHCRAVGGELALSWEHDAARWVPFDRLLTEAISAGLRRCFELFLARRVA